MAERTMETVICQHPGCVAEYMREIGKKYPKFCPDHQGKDAQQQRWLLKGKDGEAKNTPASAPEKKARKKRGPNKKKAPKVAKSKAPKAPRPIEELPGTTYISGHFSGETIESLVAIAKLLDNVEVERDGYVISFHNGA